MKGVIFNVVEEIVADLYGADAWDDILDAAGVDGAYTALGNYPDEELVAIVGAATAATDTTPDELLMTLGHHALGRLHRRMPVDLIEANSAEAFLRQVNDIIHPEVLKLYPNAQPPEFVFTDDEDGSLRVIYRSPRRLDSLAMGLISGCGPLFGERVVVSVDTTADVGENEVCFRVSFERA